MKLSILYSTTLLQLVLATTSYANILSITSQPSYTASSQISTSTGTSGIFTNIQQIVWTSAGAAYVSNTPEAPNWIATIDWSIQGSSAEAGQEFTLHLPNVYKFTDSNPLVALSVNNQDYAVCTYFSGQNIVNYSELQCVVSSLVTSSTSVTGVLNIPFTFNAGFGITSNELSSANAFQSGNNTITWTAGNSQLSTTVNFASGIETTLVKDPATLNFLARTLISTNQQQHMVMGSTCDNTFSGVIGFDFSASAGNGTIDCNSVLVGMTNSLNPWYFPKTNEHVTFTKTCNGPILVINYSSIPAGYRVVAEALITPAKGSSQTNVYYTNILTYNSQLVNYGYGVYWSNYNNGNSNSNGIEIVYSTDTWTGTETTVTTLPYTSTLGATETIEVLVPVSSKLSPSISTLVQSSSIAVSHVSIKSSGFSSSTMKSTRVNISSSIKPTSSTTSSIKSSSATKTITITKTVPLIGPSTKTSTIYPTTPGGTIIVEIETPVRFVTKTTTWSKTYTSTSTLYRNGAPTGTIEIEVPFPSPSTSTPWIQQWLQELENSLKNLFHW